MAKDHSLKITNQGIKLDIPINVQKEKQGTIANAKSYENQKVGSLMNLVMEHTKSQESYWKWVERKIDTLKMGVKEIIDIFTVSPEPSKLEKHMIMTQKLSHNVEVMKFNHEKRIDKVEQSMVEIKKNLNKLVDISKEAMNNSIEGLEKINAMVADYRSHRSELVKDLGGDDMATGDIKTTRPSSRTRSRRSNKGTSRIIMEELEEINMIYIQKNKDLVLSLN